MRGIAGLIIAAVVFAAAGGAALAVSAYERDMAAAEEHLATLRYPEAADKLASASRYARYARWVPREGARAVQDIRAHEASLQYWEQRYDALLPREADPVGAVESEDVGLQLLVANGAYRVGQSRATDKASTLQVLDEALAGYMTVLKSEQWDERAAYNYEYLVRIRDELAKGRRTATPPRDENNASLGMGGAPEKTRDMKNFEIYIPLEGEERNKASEAGKAAPNARKG